MGTDWFFGKYCGLQVLEHGGIALRLSPSAATRTAAPPVLLRIVQWLVQLRGLSILGRTEKGVLCPLQLRVPPREASLAVLRVFSLGLAGVI